MVYILTKSDSSCVWLGEEGNPNQTIINHSSGPELSQLICDLLNENKDKSVVIENIKQTLSCLCDNAVETPIVKERLLKALERYSK